MRLLIVGTLGGQLTTATKLAMENAILNFIIFHDESFSEYYQSQLGILKTDLFKLKSLPNNFYTKETITKDIDSLESLVKSWIETEAEPQIAARKEVNRTSATLKDISALMDAGNESKIMENLFSLFVRNVFTENMVFAYFLGMCSFLAVSKTVKTSLGLGTAVIFVITVAIGILNGTDLWDPPRNTLLAHVHAGTLGWIRRHECT